MEKDWPQAESKEKGRGFTLFLLASGVIVVVLCLYLLGVGFQVNLFTLILTVYMLYLLMPFVWAGVRRRKTWLQNIKERAGSLDKRRQRS